MANNIDWLNISQMTGGTGETALSLTALTNNSLDPKTATITARNTQYNVSDTTTVTIQGFQPTLTLSRSTLRFDSTGGTATFTVYSNTAWTISFPAIVHSYSASAGTGDTEVTVALAQNFDEVAKIDTGIVKDTFNVNQLYLTIVQESFIVELNVEPTDDIVFKNTGSTTAITIDSNAIWELEYPSWVTPSITSGESGTTTVTFTAGQNGPTDRNGEITVYAGSKSVTINVFQPLYIPPYITVTPTSWTFNYTEDGKTFVVDSYPGWTGEIVSTAETVWESDIYMEATFEIPSAMTMPLYSSVYDTVGIYNGPIRIYDDSIVFETSGTYKIRYEIALNGKTPSIHSTYLTNLYFSDGIGSIGGFSGCSSLTAITSDCVVAPSVGSSVFQDVGYGGTLIYPDTSDYSSWLSTRAYYLGHYFWNGIFDGLLKVATLTYDVSTTSSPIKILSDSYDVVGVMEKDIFKPFPGSGKDNTITGYTFSSTGKQSLDIYFWEDDNSSGDIYKLQISDISSITEAVFHQLPEGKTFDLSITSQNNISSVTINCKDRYTGLNASYFLKAKNINIGGNANLINGLSYWTGASLTDFIISSNAIIEIPNEYASGLTNLSSVTVTSPIATIGNYAFANTGLKNISLPSAVSSIGYFAFYQCPLASIRISATAAPEIIMSTFKEVSNGGILYYPRGADYSNWLSNSNYYLGLYGWTGQEI